MSRANPAPPPRLTPRQPPLRPQWHDLPATRQEELLRLLGRMLAGQLAASTEEESHEQH
jgi:hypothetical protein